ncbi:MAG: element excision factor XisH family protein, partial [Nodosilinea sp.]
MSARDLFHDTVKAALQKDGWAITHDPLTIDLADGQLQIDLGAER